MNTSGQALPDIQATPDPRGIAIDQVGANGGIIVSAALLLATAITAALAVPWVPDLRGKDASPLTDTEPVRLPPR